MQSRAERRRRQRELEEFERLVRAMVGEARQKARPFPEPVQIATRTTVGWEWAVSCCTHDVPGTKNVIEHWHMSAMLFPVGRGSTSEDWSFLGFGLFHVHKASGAQGSMPPPITPIEHTDPNRPHHWAWHGDGSLMSECGIQTGKAFLDDLYREPDDEKRKRKLAQAFFSNVWKKGARA